MLFTKKTERPAPPMASASTKSPSQDSEELRTGPQLSSRSSPKPLSSEVNSLLNSHLSFEGNLRYTGALTIDCEFKGSIVTDDTLVIGSSGKITSDITAGTVVISGKVSGTIRAKSRVRILAGGEVHGNIETPTLSMEDGVVFEGNCTRPTRSEVPPKAPSVSGGETHKLGGGREPPSSGQRSEAKAASGNAATLPRASSVVSAATL